MKVEIEKSEKKSGLLFQEVPVGSFYTVDSGIYYKLDGDQYLELPNYDGSNIGLQKMTNNGNPIRTLLPKGTKITITI